MTLGGRVSEEIFFGKITTGAQDDLQKITRMATEVCANYGMNDAIGPLSYRQDQEGFQKPFSEQTGQLIDEQVRKMVREAHQRTTQLLTEKREQVEKVAKLLLEKEAISREDMIRLLGERPFKEKDEETSKMLGWSKRWGGGPGGEHGRDAPLPGERGFPIYTVFACAQEADSTSSCAQHRWHRRGCTRQHRAAIRTIRLK